MHTKKAQQSFLHIKIHSYALLLSLRASTDSLEWVRERERERERERDGERERGRERDREREGG